MSNGNDKDDDRLLPGSIKHVVVLMLENRGFDHLMGWLYSRNDQPSQIVPDGGPFRGLSTYEEDNGRSLDGLANPVPNSSEGIAPIKGTRSPKVPSYGPGESYEHINRQIFGSSDIAGSVEPGALMKGYVADYSRVLVNEHTEHRNPGPSRGALSEIMEIFLPEQLPVLSGLARHYAVSDDWFCSVPSQTNTNRAFSMAGTSRGMVNNSFYDPPFRNPSVEAFRFIQGVRHAYISRELSWPGKGVSHADQLPSSTRCLFEVLEEFSLSWKVYWQDYWPPRTASFGARYLYVQNMFPVLKESGFKDCFVQFRADDPGNAFYVAAREGHLPAVSWIEPKWGGGPSWRSSARTIGNDYHPVSDTTVGEDFVMNVYNALSTGKNWSQTLLIITFDENGGTYDHVPPPKAMPSGLDRCPLSTGREQEMDPRTRTQFGFEFDRFGVRVPTLLVSPRIPPRTLFRSTTDFVPFDHTSIIATILRMANIPEEAWQLGNRVLVAPTFEGLLQGDPRPDAIKRPSTALAVSDQRSSGDKLFTNTVYQLEYVGNPWLAQEEDAVYLGGAKARGDPLHPEWCPVTSSVRAQAANVMLARHPDAVDIGRDSSVVLNMSTLYIRYEWQREWWNLFEAGQDEVNLQPSDKARWQIRLCNSRVPDEPVRVGDYVYFVSLIDSGEPKKVFAGDNEYSVSPFSDREPHRLMPRGESGFLGTSSGEWAMWRVVALEAP